MRTNQMLLLEIRRETEHGYLTKKERLIFKKERGEEHEASVVIPKEKKENSH